jgi:signal peptidase II
MIRRQPPLWRILLTALIVVVVDLWTKHWVLHSLALGESRPVLSFFYLTHVQNTGSAFGLSQGNNHALLLVALVILGVLFYSARGLYEQGGWWGELGIALIMGGAIGN